MRPFIEGVKSNIEIFNVDNILLKLNLALEVDANNLSLRINHAH